MYMGSAVIPYCFILPCALWYVLIWKDIFWYAIIANLYLMWLRWHKGYQLLLFLLFFLSLHRELKRVLSHRSCIIMKFYWSPCDCDMICDLWYAVICENKSVWKCHQWFLSVSSTPLPHYVLFSWPMLARPNEVTGKIHSEPGTIG